MRNNNNKQREGSNGRDNFRSGGNNNRNYQNKSFNGDSQEMHKVTCSECNKECEVPFKPTEGRPVYCKDCFSKHKPKRF